MPFKSIYTTQTDPLSCAQDLAHQLEDFQPKAIVFFASSHYDPDALAATLHEQLKVEHLFGCTTAGEIHTGKMLNHSVVAMAFDAAALDDICLGVVTDLDRRNRVPEVFASFERHTGQSMMALDIDRYVGLVLVDGLSGAEEKLMDTIGNLTNTMFIGGAAGDNRQFETTHVFANGMAYTNAAVLALLKPSAAFTVLKTQSFSHKETVLEATQVDEEQRLVYEFNHQPALSAYAQALDIPQDEATEMFMHHPLGLMVGNEPYVRSPQQFRGQAMAFYCQVKEGMQLHVLESQDILEDTQSAINAVRTKLDGISALLNFNCILRTLELEQQGLTDAYGKLFSEFPTAGFSTYGEEYLGHVNQTAAMLVFK